MPSLTKAFKQMRRRGLVAEREYYCEHCGEQVVLEAARQWREEQREVRGFVRIGECGASLTPDQARVPLVFGSVAGDTLVSDDPGTPNPQGRIATTLEWAKELTAEDVKLLKGQAAYSEKLPDPDAGYTEADVKDPKKAEEVFKVIRERLEKSRKERPGGYLVREAPEKDVQGLKILSGHLKEKQFVTKIRKTFARGEMEDDLLIVPAKLGQAEDHSEYEEVLPTSPP
jgi:hypothetical protein